MLQKIPTQIINAAIAASVHAATTVAALHAAINIASVHVAIAVASVLTLFCACQIAHCEDGKKAPPSAKPSLIQTKNKSAVVSGTPEQRGERIFKKHYCVGCHADGNNALMPDKPIKGAAFAKKYSDDGLLDRTIRKGFPDEGMPTFPVSQISETQMKDLILYIRSFTPKK